MLRWSAPQQKGSINIQTRMVPAAAATRRLSAPLLPLYGCGVDEGTKGRRTKDEGRGRGKVTREPGAGAGDRL